MSDKMETKRANSDSDTKILLVTANVGSLFEDVRTYNLLYKYLLVLMCIFVS